MHKEQFTGKWRQLRGRVKAEWGKLTDDELDQIEGNYDMLVGKIVEKYGQTREQVERRLDSITPADLEAPAGKTK
ncbi:MAG: CsbD family protein [bacterium]